jgi:hypothetical protein
VLEFRGLPARAWLRAFKRKKPTGARVVHPKRVGRRGWGARSLRFWKLPEFRRVRNRSEALRDMWEPTVSQSKPQRADFFKKDGSFLISGGPRPNTRANRLDFRVRCAN